MSKYQVLCFTCKEDLTSIYPIPLFCKICKYEIIDGKKKEVDKECIHYTQYSSCKSCLWGNGGKILYVDKK